MSTDCVLTGQIYNLDMLGELNEGFLLGEIHTKDVLLVTGPTGPQGITGSQILTGNGIPTISLGANGDFYLNNLTGTYYLKQSGVWVVEGNLTAGGGEQGPTGEQGPIGLTGPTGAIGPTGVQGKSILSGNVDPTSLVGIDGDFYLNITTYRMFGPRVSGAWGSGTDLLSPTIPREYFDFIGGPQPSLPQAGVGRFWLSSGGINLVSSNGVNFRFPNTPVETLKSEVNPNDFLTLYDSSISDYRKVKASTLSPLSLTNKFVSHEDDDFTCGTSAGRLNWTVTASGTGSSAQTGTYGVNGTERALGVLQLDTGTTALGRLTLNRLSNLLMIGFNSFDQLWRVAPEDISKPSERFFIQVGFIDSALVSGTGTDGVYFYYSDDLFGGNWACICRAAGVETVVNSGVAVVTQFTRLRIVINETGTEAKFYINDVLVSTIASNIPTTQGDFTGIGAKIQKSIGIVQRNLSIDYFVQRSEWSVAR